MKLLKRHRAREDEETDENGVFTSEDSIEIRRTSKNAENKK